MKVLNALFLLVCSVFVVIRSQENQTTLKLVHVLMRHGDRTPFHVYPNDPYTEHDYHPIPVGELTNAGKNRAYNIGLTLGRTYRQFLGDFYSPQIVKAITSPYSRCMDSAVLVINDIFPTVGSQKWRFDVVWQPVSYEYNTVNDKLFLVYKYCPNFRKFQDERAATQEYLEVFKPWEDLIAYMRFKSGDYKEKYVFAYSIYSTLLAETEMGLIVPDWAATLFPGTLEEIAKVEIHQMYSGKNKILGAGHFMRKLVNDTILKLEDFKEMEDRKLFIYSGHDMNIAATLSWLDVYEPHLPNYGAYLIFEIHVIENLPYIKILHENNEEQSPKPINIGGCGVLCPLHDFFRLYESRLTADELCG